MTGGHLLAIVILGATVHISKNILLGGALLLAATVKAIAGDREPALPLQSTPTHGQALRGHFSQPLGETVLYDQSGIDVVNIVAQDFPDLPSYSSQVADDFTVSDPIGWTVLSVAVQEDTSQTTDIPGVLYNVDIFADDGGMPAAQAVCDYIDQPAGFDATNTVASIALDHSCFLQPGTYWLSATPSLRFDTGGQLYAWLGDTGTQFGAAPFWRNPGGAFGGTCTTWTPLTACADLHVDGITATSAMLFQIVGHTGGQPGRINLTVGVALDNGDPNQCGTATTLSATVGDAVNFCYTVVNNAPFATNYQSLSDTVSGTLLSYAHTTIDPGATYQYNRIVTATTSAAPVSTWSSNDIQPGYTASAGTYNFVDITSTGTPLDIADQDGGSAVTMPFSFTLNGSSSNVLCVENNGIVMFGVSDGCQNHFYNFPMPTTFFSAPTFVLFWANFFNAGNVYVETLGTAPNRRYVVEYYNKDTYDAQGENPGFTVELILNESDGTIDYNYQTVVLASDPLNSGGGKDSVGIQLSTSLANIYSENTVSLVDGQNIHWSAALTPIVFSDSKRVTLDVGAPFIYAVPGPLASSAVAGAAVVMPMYLLNTGNRDLDWSMLEAPGSARAAVTPSAALTAAHAPAGTETGLPPASSSARTSAPDTIAPFGSATVPAFGVAFYATGKAYVGFDAAAPDPLNTIAQTTQSFVSGTFANFDFSQEYVVDSTAGDLYTISTSDGSLQRIGNTGLPAGTTVGGLRWDATTGTTYMMSATCSDDIGSNTSTLYTIDLATATTTLVATDVGSLSCMVDIAIDPLSGELYALDARADLIWTLDKGSGEITGANFVDFDVEGAQGLDFDASTGTLYLAGFDGTTANMYTVDTNSGTTSLIGPLGADGVEVAAFAIARATPPCTRPEDIPWLSLSAASGTTGPGLISTIDVTMDAASLAAGDYTATLCVHSNDYLHPLVVIPVSLTVSAANVTDPIFVDGFDGN